MKTPGSKSHQADQEALIKSHERAPTVALSHLKLGDIVRIYDGSFGDAIVKKIDEVGVTVERPYMTSADFSYGGEDYSKVVTWIGHEDVTYRWGSAPVLRLLQAKKPEVK